MCDRTIYDDIFDYLITDGYSFDVGVGLIILVLFLSLPFMWLKYKLLRFLARG